MKRTFTLFLLSAAFTGLSAQEPVKPFSSVDFGITAGTTGVGIEASVPMTRWMDVRGGFDFYPHFKRDMNFNVTVGDESGLSEAEQQSKFGRMSDMLYDLTGYRVDNKVTMEGVPKMFNFKLLADFKPLKNKHWHVTAGFYIGNRRIATAENSKEDMTALFAVGMYNHLYDCAADTKPYATIDGQDIYLPEAAVEKLLENGRMAVHVGTYKHDIPYQQDTYYKSDVYDAEGNVIHHEGDLQYKAGVDIEHHAGDPYNMEPDEHSMVKAAAKAHLFKPYVGIGYMGALSKKDPSWKIGFDLGALFWGGDPSVKTHDGTDLVNDVTDYRHNLKKYMNLVKALPVLPVANLRITKTL